MSGLTPGLCQGSPLLWGIRYASVLGMAGGLLLCLLPLTRHSTRTRRQAAHRLIRTLGVIQHNAEKVHESQLVILSPRLL